MASRRPIKSSRDSIAVQESLPSTAVARRLPAEVWLDRDLSWIEFNARVLHEALDERTPLLERCKFLAIFTSNLDEFFMKRVGAMRTRAYARETPATIDDFNRRMSRLRTALSPLLARQARCYEELLPKLAAQGIRLATWATLTEAQRAEASDYFDRHVSAALIPLSMDPAHPFPFLSNLSLSWGFRLVDPETGEERPARVKVPASLVQWIPLHADLDANTQCFISLQELIRHNAGKLFPGVEIADAMLFRVSRNADIALDEQGENSLRELVEEQLRQRRFQPVVRIEFGRHSIPSIKTGLIQQLGLGDCDVYEVEGLIDYTSLFEIAAIDDADLRDPPWTPIVPSAFEPESDIFATIRAGDVLVHHPYDSFDASVERFIRNAADDPQTVSIKMTVYRLGDDTPFVHSLIKAAETGKQVACLVELTARFDEARNLHWANELRQAGDHVIYGVRGLKTHTKLALVVRRESGGLRCYAHIATGNYHVKTARLYTDLGLFTADPTLTRDVVNLFHHLTGYSRTPQFEKLLVAPMNMRERFLAMIRREVEHARAQRPARIIAKMNQLDDVPIAEALIEASRAGVQIDLIVRGFCCLAPGVRGWTENLRVRSIVGRFLEHARVFYFANASEDPLSGDFYIGSADWMDRNLNRRVEAVTPVEQRSLRERLWDILNIHLADERNAWTMQSDGSYRQLSPSVDSSKEAALGSHLVLMSRARRRAAGAGAVSTE
jgi:polyphosphate kinase